MDVIFDIDGTLADGSHRMHHIQSKPKNWKAFFEAQVDDPPIKPVVNLLQELWATHNTILFCTARPEDYRAQTEKWLKDVVMNAPWWPNPVYPRPNREPLLYMRAKGDFRNDDIVKSELLDQMIREGYDPVIAFEDRKRVVKMFRERGLIVCHVAEGDF